MKRSSLGQIIMPTGSGKTICMIQDCIDRFTLLENKPAKMIVVAPRIVLAQQLCDEFIKHEVNAAVFHVHSGRVQHFSSTDAVYIKRWSEQAYRHQIYFTTYNSLAALVKAKIHADTIYFDEAHHSVKRHFFPVCEVASADYSDRTFWFTATRRVSNDLLKPGMNDEEVYGKVLHTVSLKELVDKGYIAPAKVSVSSFDKVKKDDLTYQIEADNLIQTIDNGGKNKILICCRSTRQMMGMIHGSDLSVKLRDRGFDLLTITSKYGPTLNGHRISRSDFMLLLNEYGENPNKKFCVFHYSILTEGISINELDSCVFLRNMNVVAMQQCIGRVIRKGRDSYDGESKVAELAIPSYSQVGVSTARQLNNIVDATFNQGQSLISEIK